VSRSPSAAPTTAAIRAYWNVTIHDLQITKHAVGSPDFFADLDKYRFDKLHHLLRLIPFREYRGRRVLEVGCGEGTDLVRFARHGARVTGIDIADSAISLAHQNVRQQGLHAHLLIADGERLPFADRSFELVYAHGVVQYTADGQRLVEECGRVLKPGAQAIFQVYNRLSWLNALSNVMHVDLEHADAPALRRYSIDEFRSMLTGFSRVRVVPERFPVRSRLHKGWKGALYNGVFVGTFNVLPRALLRPLGWHLLAFCER